MLDALNVGMLCMGRKSEAVIRQGVMDFVSRYGLLGLMTALPTTPHFMDYKAVYLPKNRFLTAESMRTEDFLKLFFPFDALDAVKKGIESGWNINQDRAMIALAMTFSDQPMAMNRNFQQEYGERYDWVVAQFKSLFHISQYAGCARIFLPGEDALTMAYFVYSEEKRQSMAEKGGCRRRVERYETGSKDWAFTLVTSVFYYMDYDRLDEAARNVYRMGMAAFGGIAPTTTLPCWISLPLCGISIRCCWASR